MKLTREEIEKLEPDELIELADITFTALRSKRVGKIIADSKERLRLEKLNKLSKSSELLYLNDDFMAITIEQGNVWVSDLNKSPDYLYDIDDGVIKDILAEYITQEYKKGNLNLNE